MRRWAGAFLVTAVIVIAAAGVWLSLPLWSHKVYDGVLVANIEVGGKTRDEVAQLLHTWQKNQKTKPILLSYGTTTFRLEPENIDYAIDFEATADAAWEFGRQGSWWARIKNIRAAGQQSYLIPLKIKYNENKLDTIFEHLQETVNRPPRNATLSLRTGGVVSEEPGCQIDVVMLKTLVVEALYRTDPGVVVLPVQPVYPEITASDLANTGIKELVAMYTTVFNIDDVNRTANVRLAAQKINGQLIYPGQVFSFNDTVGPREKSLGFKEAMEIIDGEFVPGVGGGVCQVSSTLYNAAILAGMGIAERTNHSKPLAYVPLGRDATVVYGTIDFKFANNSPTPLMVLAETAGDKLHVAIFGQRALDKTIEVLAVDQQTIQPTTIKKADPELLPGESKIDKPGKPGFEVTIVRVIRDSAGKEIEREVLSHDRYAPDNTVIKIGLAPNKPITARPQIQPPILPPDAGGDQSEGSKE